MVLFRPIKWTALKTDQKLRLHRVKNYPCSVSRSSIGREILGAFPPRGQGEKRPLMGAKFVLKRTVYNR